MTIKRSVGRLLTHRPRTSELRLALLFMLLAGIGWRWSLWTRYRFREDEALYAHWAWLVYSGIDVMLEQAAVDKPPLFPYTVARLFGLFTPSEAVARLPNLWASTLALPLLYGWAQALVGRAVAWRAMWLYTVMPLSVLMAPTAYTDALMMGWLLLSAWAATRQKPHRIVWAGVSGLALGASLATKPFAALWIPVVALSAWATQRPRKRWWLTWILGLIYPLWLWWRWEQLRAAPNTLFLAMAHYGGMGWSSPDQWIDRGRKWLEVARDSWGGWGWLLAGSITAIIGALNRDQKGRTARCGLLLWWLLTAGGYVLSTLEPWDRYLLVLAPVGVVLVAAGWAWGQTRWIPRRGWIFLSIFVITFGIGWRSSQAAYPVGGDHGAYDGVDQLSAYIMAELPRGGVIYHRWLGWHYGFYLFGAPYDYRWWPDIEWLVKDASRPDGIPRVIAFPFWAEGTRQRVLARLQAAGVPVCLRYRVYDRDGRLRFYLYRLGPLSSPDAFLSSSSCR